MTYHMGRMIASPNLPGRIYYKETFRSSTFVSNLGSLQFLRILDRAIRYATTIHKSQGSEYPIVVMPILMTHYVMLQRNLIYTGITRAKKICVLLGTKKALSFAIRNMSVLKRNTKLKERLNPSSEHQEHKIYSISKESEYMIAAEPTVENNKK